MTNLPRFSFSSPKRAGVAVIDAEGSAILARLCLQGLDYSVVNTRRERFLLSPRLLLRALLLLARGGLRRGRVELSLAGRVYGCYLRAWLELISPKVVLTWVDDSKHFQNLSRTREDIPFYAVSNSFRFEHPVKLIYEGFRHSMPNMVCYGRFEEELYRAEGHDIDVFHPAGPPQAAYYKTEVSPGVPPRRWDICLVSQADPAIISGVNFPAIRKAIVLQDQFLARFVKERGLKLAVALRSASREERDYFAGAYGGAAELVPSDRLNFSTYRAMDAAHVVITFCSTAGVEAYGWGKKLFFTNYSATARYRLPVPEPLLAESPDYAEFERKLSAVLAMTPAEYETASGENRRRLVTWDQAKPAHAYIRNLVLEALKNP